MYGKFLKFIKSSSGKTILVLVVFSFVAVTIWYVRNMSHPAELPRAELDGPREKTEVVIRDKGKIFNDSIFVKNKPIPPKPVNAKEKPAPRSPVKISRTNYTPAERKRNTTVTPLQEILPMDIYSEPPGRVKSISDNYAPYGAMLECQLVNAIDSSSLQTPIIAIVTKDWSHGHKVIIPAGTLVYGTASKSAMRDRIGASSRWVLVWRTLDGDNGKELKITGIALNKEKSGSTAKGGQWGLLDGSAGIKGDVIQSTDMAQLMALAAAFLAGAGEGMTSSDIVVGGSSTIITNNSDDKGANIIGQGVSQAAKLYAKMMMEQVSQQGYFVRVPPGKEFYIFVPQTIDLNDAMIGGVSLRNTR